jgi:TonB family protein
LTRGLYKSEPKPKVKEPEAVKLPKFEKQKPEIYRSRPSRVDEVKEPPLVGAIPYGQGGAPSLPYGQFQVGPSTAGMEFGAEGGFGDKFPWYVDAVRRRISSNWLITTIDPSIQWAPRVIVGFEIARDGSILNLQFLRRSGLASVDRAALRAIQDSSPLDRLPSEYGGNRVSVEFWFDFRR